MGILRRARVIDSKLLIFTTSQDTNISDAIPRRNKTAETYSCVPRDMKIDPPSTGKTRADISYRCYSSH